MAKSATEKLLDELDQLAAKGRISPEEYEARRGAIIAGNIAPAAEKKGGGIFKWGLLGCLGILAAVGLFFVVLIVAIGAAIDDAADDEPDTGGDVHVTLAPGASGVIAPEGNGSKKSKVTILQIADNVPSANQFIQPQPGKKWIGFEVEVENVGTAQVTSLDWTLRDTTDQEHDRTFWTGAEGAAIDIAYSDLTPGGKKRGWVYFEVDQAAGIRWLRADPNPFLANDLYFDAP